MWDKNKVYGYSKEYILEHGEPEDNRVMIESNEDEILTIEEINRMFPCQVVALTNVNWADKENDVFSFTSASVKYYHCDANEAAYMEASGEIEYSYHTIPSELRSPLLWL